MNGPTHITEGNTLAWDKYKTLGGILNVMKLLSLVFTQGTGDGANIYQKCGLPT